ncbi:MAG: 4Fe-4S dicluster domain-containing protein, partial [Roseobacter sp.]|nr:4Fe-4S dicluster domain-containing protein [Roseobacter sp.]
MTPESLKNLLDRCVKCGLCLPECPTYRLASEESESPRGRLSLIQGLLDGQLEADRALRQHLDHCLGCRRCERLCPSAVPYGELIDNARTLIGGRRDTMIGIGWLQHASIIAWTSRLARAIPTGLSRPLSGLHRMHRIGRALPPSGRQPPGG